MYELRFRGRQKKKFKKLLEKLSARGKERLKDTLKNHPYPSSSFGGDLCKVEKKGDLYCYEVTGGDRVLYDVIEYDDVKIVLIQYAGDEDGEIRFLKKHAR